MGGEEASGSVLMKAHSRSAAPAILSPSAIARYFLHGCHRFLRLRTMTNAGRRTAGLGARPFDTSAVQALSVVIPAVGRLFAVPAPLAPTLPEVAGSLLGDATRPFEYRRSARYDFPI